MNGFGKRELRENLFGLTLTVIAFLFLTIPFKVTKMLLTLI